jgi:hypothetical protein
MAEKKPRPSPSAAKEARWLPRRQPLGFVPFLRFAMSAIASNLDRYCLISRYTMGVFSVGILLVLTMRMTAEADVPLFFKDDAILPILPYCQFIPTLEIYYHFAKFEMEYVPLSSSPKLVPLRCGYRLS